MPNESVPGSCAPCKATGLPIMPVRYAVVPQAIIPALPSWASGERVKSVKVGPDFQYALRTLRTGYIYLFYEKHARGNRLWECYGVYPDGSLRSLPPDRYEESPPTSDTLQCATQSHVAKAVHYLVIEQPEKCGTTWMAFTQHQWSNQTREAYAADAALRAKRMQSFQPAQMVGGAKNAHGAVADQTTLEGVLEYSRTVSTVVLPHEVGPGQTVDDISKEDGSLRPGRLEKMSTRYAWWLRADKAPSTALHMQGRAKAAGGQPGTPHVLALWDAIGIAHELNGFRNDAAGWISQYGNERSLQLTASSALKRVRKTLERNASAYSDRMIERSKGLPDLYEAQESRARSMLRTDPDDKFAQEELADALAKRAKHRQAVSKGTEDFKRTNIATAWPQYHAKLNQAALEKFQHNSGQFFTQADALINQRTVALINWLEAPLFVDTLEDFHKKNVDDGMLFESVVGDVCFGMGSCQAGQIKIDEWVKQAQASVRTNLLWRAIALNQQEGIEEVDAALAHARAGTNVVLSAESWAVVALNVKWNKLASVYKNAQGFANSNIRAIASSGAMKEAKGLGFLKIFASMGDRVLPAFMAKRIDSVVSEKVFQSLFLLRAGAHVDDVLGLVREQAAVESIDRFAMVRRIQSAEVFANVMEDGQGRLRPNAEVLQRKWSNLAKGADQVGKDGRFNAAKDARLALVVAVLEAFNLAKTGYDASVKQDAKSMLVLGSAVAALAAAATDVYANVVKGALEEASLTFQRLKFVGGLLSGVASIASIGAAILDLNKYEKEENSDFYRLGLSNVLFISIGGVANVLTTLSYCGPWLITVAEKQSSRRIAVAGITRLAAAVATRMVMYRTVLMGVGLGLSLASLGIQIAIWHLTDDELQSWCEKCPFGQKRDFNWTKEKLTEELYKATYAVGADI